MSPYNSPYTERVNDHGELEDLVDDIVAEYTQQEVDKEEEEDQLILEPLPLVTHDKVLNAMQHLR